MPDPTDHAPIGHNVPPPPAPLTPEQIREWLTLDLSTLVERGKELTAALAASIEAAPVIETEEQMAAIADNVRMAGAWGRTAEARRKDAKAPFLDGGREIDAWFREVGEPLAKPLAACQKAMDAYQARLAAQRRAEAEAAAAAARAEAERKAQEAVGSIFGDDHDSEEDAARAMEKMEAAQRAAGRADRLTAKADGTVAAHVRAHTDLGTVATARETLEFDVTDERLIPREFLVVDHNRVRGWLRDQTKTTEGKASLRAALDRGEQPIAGIKVRIEVKAMVR